MIKISFVNKDIFGFFRLVLSFLLSIKIFSVFILLYKL